MHHHLRPLTSHSLQHIQSLELILTPFTPPFTACLIYIRSSPRSLCRPKTHTFARHDHYHLRPVSITTGARHDRSVDTQTFARHDLQITRLVSVTSRACHDRYVDQRQTHSLNTITTNQGLSQSLQGALHDHRRHLHTRSIRSLHCHVRPVSATLRAHPDRMSTTQSQSLDTISSHTHGLLNYIKSTPSRILSTIQSQSLDMILHTTKGLLGYIKSTP